MPVNQRPSKKKGGSFDPAVMNTKGLMDQSHNIYAATINDPATPGLLSMHAPFSAGMNAFTSGMTNDNAASLLPPLGTVGGAKKKAAPKPKTKTATGATGAKGKDAVKPKSAPKAKAKK